ncbi:MAG: EAL domain-containing protein [Alphaproteobacteria bacterium]|nr:EAL domain-containing protein [Alphaproteobacteria bacterium]
MFFREWSANAFKALTFGLGRRLALVFGLLLSSFVATAILTNLHLQLELIERRLDNRIEHLGKLLFDVTASYLYELRLSDLELIYEDLQRQPDIDYVYVVDQDSMKLASGSIEVGETFLHILEDALADEVTKTGEHLRESDENTEHIGLPVKLGTEFLGTVRFGIALDSYHQDLRSVWIRNLVAGMAFVVVGVFLSILVARRLTRSLDDFIAMTDRASHGELDQSIELQTNDELEHLASSFNTMLEGLRRSMSEIQQLAYQDKLTSLPNRAWFQEFLKRTIADAVRSGESVALVFLDLDRFKHVNDTLGHHVGDQLLAAFARRLQACIRQSDAVAVMRSPSDPEITHEEGPRSAVARLGGDEFTIVLSHLSKSEDVAIVAERIVASLVEPFDLGGEVFLASTSIGIAMFPADGDTPEELLKHADAAMYQAKQAGRNTYCFFDANIAQIAIRRVTLEREIRRAIEEEEFKLYLQPQFSVVPCHVVGAEALIRWQHPVEGLLTPDRFMDVAGEAKLMSKIGRVMVRAALRAAVDWPLVCNRPLRLAVNISVEELEAEDFSDWILEQIRETGFDPHAFEIEVTEGTAMLDSDSVETQVKALRAAGVRFAVDDFGVGYSNLARLKRLAFQTLKIDQSLMHGVGFDRDTEILVASILSMAGSLDLDVVAEGIETEEQLAFLQRNGCSYAQGYFLSRPMPQEAFPDWVRSVDAAAFEASTAPAAS